MAARLLRQEGLTSTEIGRRLGVSDSLVRNWWRGGECADCGAPTSDRGVERCASCAAAHQTAERFWTAEAIVEAIRRFAAVHGRPPTSLEWMRSDPANGYPAATTTYSHRGAPFDSWNDAIRAAGFSPAPRGHYERSGRQGISRGGQAILASLESQSPQALHQLAGYGRAERQAVNQSLRHLIRRGLVVRVRRGVYALAEPAAEEAA